MRGAARTLLANPFRFSLPLKPDGLVPGADEMLIPARIAMLTLIEVWERIFYVKCENIFTSV